MLLKLPYISDVAKRWGGKNIYDLIDREIKGKYNATNMTEVTKPQIKKYKIDRARLFKGSKHSMYLHEDIAITIIMQSRLSDSKAIPLLKAFYAEKIKLQYKALENKRVRTEMYFLSIHFL